MADKHAPKGGDKPKLKKAHPKGIVNKGTSEDDHEVSFDIMLPTNPSIEQLQSYFERKFNALEEKYNKLEISTAARVETLHKVIQQKDDVIGKLNVEIGELKKSYSFLSSETAEIKTSMKQSNEQIAAKFETTNSLVKENNNKSIDLEDRSRRSNLIFYNFPEARDGETENCEQLIHNIISSRKIFNPDEEEIWIDRAHRLGPRKPDNDRPRPIIAKFTYFKHKEEIIKKGHLFKGCDINVSEDFSKETMKVRKQLIEHGRKAKVDYCDNQKSITYFRVAYKCLILTYSSNKRDPQAKTFTRSFRLDYINRNSKWFLPPLNKPTAYSTNQHQ